MPTSEHSTSGVTLVPDLPGCGVWNDELTPIGATAIPWIWDGYVVLNAITLLTGPSKIGKTTLLSLLLDRRRAGGQLLGQTVDAGGAIIVTEEDPVIWGLRQRGLNFGPDVVFLGTSMAPTRRDWRRTFRDVRGLLCKTKCNLVVIDSLASFLPGGENHAATARKYLQDLRFVCDCAGVLVLHQARRQRGRAGQSSRGSGALTAFADILVDLRAPADPLSRRRSLHAVGRYPGIPPRLDIELNADGTDYTILSDAAPDPGFAPALDVLRDLLQTSSTPLTRAELLERWPIPTARPAQNTLWRWLERACKMGVLKRQGAGNKTVPFRYWLAAVVAESKQKAQEAAPGDASQHRRIVRDANGAGLVALE